MPMKGMLGRLLGSHHDATPAPQSLSATLMEENIANAESVISKWDLASPHSNLAPLFHSARHEAADFCRAVHGLQRAMVFFSSGQCPDPPETRAGFLVRAQNLMQAAMKRLEREFYLILSANRDRLDPESVTRRSSPRSSVSDREGDSEDEIRHATDSIGEVERASAVAMADLRLIAQTMIAAGYGRECVRIYKILRKSIVDEGLYRLGFEPMGFPQIQKLDWDVVELKIRSWLFGAGTAIRTLFAGERILCDSVFEGSERITESCFAEITADAAVHFLGFPELVARAKRSPEKMFRILDLYNCLTELWTDIESVFSSETTEAVRSQAGTTLLKLAEAARGTLAEFEAAIQRDASKAAVPGGGVHPLTRYVMNYLVFLADYEPALADIFLDFPPPAPAQIPESLTTPSSFDSPASAWIAWLVLVLLCKLDGKAELYKDVALAYLFLANNLNYVVGKVKESGLAAILGADWGRNHEAKVRHYVSSYERLAWGRVAATVPAVGEPPVEAAERVKAFYAAFEEAVRVQRDWVVAGEVMREEVRELVAELIVPAYRGFYETYRPVFAAAGVSVEAAVVRYAPEDVRARIMELFGGGGAGSGSHSGSGSSRSASGSGSGSNKSAWWSFSH